MRIGLLSDAHGNPEGVRACAAALRERGVDQLRFLGDAAGYFPDVSEVLALLGSLGAECIRGNHDAMLIGELEVDPARDEVYRIAAARSTLPPVELDRVRAWPSRRTETWGPLRVLLVHGSPWDELQGRVYPDSDLTGFSSLPFDWVFVANTHRPFVGSIGNVHVANVGSCGLPRDQGDAPSCMVFDAAVGTCEIVRAHIDASALARRYAPVVHPTVLECLSRQASQTLEVRRGE